MNTVDALDLSVGYCNDPVLEGLTFAVPNDQSLLVIGHNGAGKTTFLRTLFGLQPVLSGQARLLGVDVRRSNPTEWMQMGVRFLGQGPRSFDELPVRVHRNALGKLYGWTPGLTPVRGDIASRKVGLLSLGQRRIEALMLLRCGSTKLFLLDEPTAGLDAAHSAQVIDWIANARTEGCSFIVVEHNFRRLLRFIEFTLVFRGNEISYMGPSRPLLDDAVLAQHLL